MGNASQGGNKYKERKGFLNVQENKEQFEKYVQAVDARLSGKRLKHVHSVSDYAEEVARVYGINPYDAKVAGLLHDWDKLLTDEELIGRMDELGIEHLEHEELLLPVLHSFTGAVAVKREFPEVEPQIIKAIWNHTLGAVEMTDLDMLIFIVDSIEPRRSAEKRPALADLRAMVGKAPLDEIYFAAYMETMRSLINRRRFIHPMAFEVWNGLVQKHHPAPGAKGQGNPDAVL